jgi:hypothetical protein
MLNLLGGDRDFIEPSSIAIPGPLSQLLAEGFMQESDLNLLCSLASQRASLLNYLLNRDDQTGIEAAINEIHIEDFLVAQLPFFELARLGCDFAFALAKRLQDKIPNTRFRVIVSAIQHGETETVRDTCVVRFHAQRKHQAWLDENLENYRCEAVGVFDV